jgi:hypothetical protein
MNRSARSASTAELNARLLSAAAAGDQHAVEQTLERGAQVSAPNRHGDTALHLATRNKHPGVAALPIARGADVNRPNELGDTPLHVSVYTQQGEVAQQLRDKGASAEALNRYGLNAAEMEAVPAVEAAVRELAALLGPGGQWRDARTARVKFDDLKRGDPRLLTNALVLQVIQISDTRFRTIVLAIKLGVGGSEDKLGAVLMVYGDKPMAEDYLNSGSSSLRTWAGKWAAARGYTVRSGVGSRRAQWGTF